LQTQASKFEKQAKNRQFYRKTRLACYGTKIQENEKSAKKIKTKNREVNPKKQAQNDLIFGKTRLICL